MFLKKNADFSFNAICLLLILITINVACAFDIDMCSLLCLHLCGPLRDGGGGVIKCENTKIQRFPPNTRSWLLIRRSELSELFSCVVATFFSSSAKIRQN